MKKSSLKSRTFVRVLSMAMTLLALRQNVLARKKSAPRILLAAILPLSSSPRGSRMFFKGIICSALVFACMSCKSHRYGLDALQAVQDSVALYSVVRSVDTVVVRDSVFVSERQKGDTVYLTRVEWRDRWRTHIVHDTVVKTDSIVQIVDHPPERYVPPFYKRCTIALWVIGLLAIGRFAIGRLRL